MQAYSGFFADGRQAARQPARALLRPNGLAILDSAGKQMALWPYRSLRLVEEVYRDQPVRLRSTAGEGRLSVHDQSILEALRAHTRGLKGGDMRGARMLPRAVAWTGATVATLVALYFGLPLLAEPIAALVPRTWEERLGAAVVRQVGTLFGRNGRLVECRAPAGKAALDRLVARLVAQAETDYVFRVQVVDSPIVNALAAPGGYVLIFRGLIDRANSPEEVAGVLGHEMGHVIERHGTESLIRMQGMKLLLGTVAEGGTIEYGTTLLSLSYGRAAEREADRVGVALLNRADIRGAGLVGFFRRVGKESGESGGVMRYLSTHPPTGERAAEIEATSIGRGDAMSAAEWQALRSICSVKG
ncbi:MAG: M48 family metallopeptidase [Rhodospirillaceae bacterium]|nr:M48 family metallopeptidase [Rhodospirillaceae bacterium]